MKNEKYFKTMSYIIGAMIFIVGSVSLVFSAYSFFSCGKLSDFVIKLLTGLNISVPIIGIAVMLMYINSKNKPPRSLDKK